MPKGPYTFQGSAAKPAGVPPKGRSKAESTNCDALHHTLKWIAEAQLHPLDPVMTAAN